MRALIWVAVSPVVLTMTAAADPPRRYKCNDYDEVREECICDPGAKPARDNQNNAVCVRAPPAWPRLRLRDPLPVNAVGPSSTFTIEVSGLVDGVQVELCADQACVTRLLVSDQQVVARRVQFAFTELPSDSDLYWRARASRQTKLGPPTPIRSFHTQGQPARVAGIDLDVIDQQIVARQYDEVVAAARTSRSAADHVEIALRLAKASQCPFVLQIVGLTHAPSKDQRAQLGQLQLDCDASATSQQVIAAADAGDQAAGQAALASYMTAHAEHMNLTFWSEAYLAAKRTPADCDTARNRVVLAGSLGLTPPTGGIAQTIDQLCPPNRPPEPPSSNRFPGVFAGVDYESPFRGERTREGLRYVAGVRGHLDDTHMLSIGWGLSALRPFQRGIDARLGATWGILGTFSAGSREPASFGVRLELETFMGRGKYVVEDDQHTCFVMDMLVGITFRKRIVPHVFIAARTGLRAGYLVDFADQPSDSYLDRFMERWHGTLSFDAGISLQVR
ncbi:MAG: hypothetical protein WKG01_01595 [Kofleriaceae bacterium]